MRKKIIKKRVVFEIIILVITASFVSVFHTNPSIATWLPQGGNWLYVGGFGPGNYSMIQDAINHASTGDIVFVYDDSAPYYEHLVINRPITLIGENRSLTIIDGKNTSTLVSITSDDVTITQFTFCNTGGRIEDAGLYITADNTSIINCTVYRARTGIIIHHGTNHKILNCHLHTTGEGIYCIQTTITTVSQCQFCHNAIGIRFNNSINCVLEALFFHTNGLGCYFDKTSNITIHHCALVDNNDNQGGAYLTHCKQVLFTNCNICHNGVGIKIRDTQDVQITHCDINLNTKIAVLIEEGTSNITLHENEINKNYHYGIYTNVPVTAYNNNFCDNELHALYATMPCNATRNWWNTRMGPAVTAFRFGERISRLTVHRFPWLLDPVLDAGSTWETKSYFTANQILATTQRLDLPGNDTDHDGAPDWWELKYGFHPSYWENHTVWDIDYDGLTNLEECYTDTWGSNPYKKDIFIEIDWMETNYPQTTNKPDEILIEEAIAVFEEQNITLHIDTGNLGGGEIIPYQSLPSVIDFRNLYWDYFLHEDLNQPRKGIFRYAIITDDGEAGYTIFGWDQLDFFNCGAQQIKEKFPWYTKKRIIQHVILHELGHCLGLFGDTFGGIDNRESVLITSWHFWKYHPYKSCMNYHYTYLILGYSDGTHGKGDFNDWAHINLSLFKNTSFPLLSSK